MIMIAFKGGAVRVFFLCFLFLGFLFVCLFVFCLFVVVLFFFWFFFFLEEGGGGGFGRGWFTVSNTYAQVARAQSCANHVQHIESLSSATRRVTCNMLRRDGSAIKFDRVIVLALSDWLNHIPMRGLWNWSTLRKPLTTSFRKCHILQTEDSSPNRDSNPHCSVDGRLRKQTCYRYTNRRPLV